MWLDTGAADDPADTDLPPTVAYDPFDWSPFAKPVPRPRLGFIMIATGADACLHR